MPTIAELEANVAKARKRNALAMKAEDDAHFSHHLAKQRRKQAGSNAVTEALVAATRKTYEVSVEDLKRATAELTKAANRLAEAKDRAREEART